MRNRTCVAGRNFFDLPTRLDAVAVGQPHIHQNHVRAMAPGGFHRGQHRARLGHDLDARLQFLDPAQTIPHDRMVIHEQQLDEVCRFHDSQSGKTPHSQPAFDAAGCLRKTPPSGGSNEPNPATAA
ncbi:MAG: hypothetical protein V9H26_23025 [Verrucomicrobiota bacterium]